MAKLGRFPFPRDFKSLRAYIGSVRAGKDRFNGRGPPAPVIAATKQRSGRHAGATGSANPLPGGEAPLRGPQGLAETPRAATTADTKANTRRPGRQTKTECRSRPRRTLRGGEPNSSAAAKIGW